MTARLLAAHAIHVETSPLHEFNEEARIPGLIAALRAGRRIALVSDAGTPLVSDPGYRLVRAAIAAEVPVDALPGPNAAVLALVLSGLPPQPFLFLGFPPPRGAARRAAFGRLRAAERAGLSATLIWHEAPHRLAEMLADLHGAFGDRPAAVARELTKRFEEVPARRPGHAGRVLRRNTGPRGDHRPGRPGGGGCGRQRGSGRAVARRARSQQREGRGGPSGRLDRAAAADRLRAGAGAEP